jgi:ABC-type sulfate transport system permease component
MLELKQSATDNVIPLLLAPKALGCIGSLLIIAAPIYGYFLALDAERYLNMEIYDFHMNKIFTRAMILLSAGCCLLVLAAIRWVISRRNALSQSHEV